MKHALTIDLEDAHNIGMYDLFGIQASPSKAVVRNTMRILEILGAYNVRATFFVLGEVARTFPSLIRLIADQGHEIGVHGYHHIQFFRMNPKRAFEALSLAKKEIEQISGYHVLGHRAPAFSVRPDTAWVLETLAEVGFKYDSSIVPCKGRRYGWPGFPKDINVIKLSGGETIVEAPLSTINLLGKNIPVCGGGYLRHFPFLYTRWAIRRVEKKMIDEALLSCQGNQSKAAKALGLSRQGLLNKIAAYDIQVK